MVLSVPSNLCSCYRQQTCLRCPCPPRSCGSGNERNSLMHTWRRTMPCWLLGTAVLSKGLTWCWPHTAAGMKLSGQHDACITWASCLSSGFCLWGGRSPHPSWRIIVLDGYDVSVHGWPATHPLHQKANQILDQNNPHEVASCLV